MKIAVIGSGHIGSTVGRLWTKAGHDVYFGVRRPEEVAQRLRAQGVVAQAGAVEAAAAYGEVVFVAVPYGCWPELSAALGPLVAGKVVIDAGNPYPQRDGVFAQQAIDGGEGAGVPVARLLPGARLVRGFNAVFWRVLESEAHRKGPRVGVPLAGDDEAALAVASQLVTDAGFDPVVVGPLLRARDFDPGTRVYNTGMTAAQLTAALHESQGRTA
jgi:predicted dinucleotide-binding enzyme